MIDSNLCIVLVFKTTYYYLGCNQYYLYYSIYCNYDLLINNIKIIYILNIISKLILFISCINRIKLISIINLNI